MNPPSPTNKLLEYARKELAEHIPIPEIETRLLVAGWTPEDVKKVIEQLKRGEIEPQVETTPEMENIKAHPHSIVSRIFVFIMFAVIIFLVIAYILGGS